MVEQTGLEHKSGLFCLTEKWVWRGLLCLCRIARRAAAAQSGFLTLLGEYGDSGFARMTTRTTTDNADYK